MVIKSKVPGLDYLMLEEQTARLNSVADVFEVMGIPLEEEEEEEDEEDGEQKENERGSLSASRYPSFTSSVRAGEGFRPRVEGFGRPVHYGTKTGHFETSIIHCPTNEGVSE